MQRISSRDNPLVRRLRALARSPRECRKQGESILDGPHLVQAALQANFPLKAVAVAESALQVAEIASLLERCAPCAASVLPDALFAQVSPVDTPTGVLALIDVPARPVEEIGGKVLVLEAVQDAGNLGSMLRSAAAAGVRHVLLTPGCAQAWSPRVLRAGMGAHFSLAIREQADVEVELAAYRGRIVATVPAPGARSLFETDLRGDLAWLVGSEGAGLSERMAALADLEVRIPMPGGTESLNVAAATAICLFEQWRQAGR